jgi:hypothetical protein
VGKNKQMIKLFVVLLLSTFFIFSFSHFGVKAFENINNVSGKYSNGTTIGGLDLSGKTENEAMNLLNEKYVGWVKGTKMTLQYMEKSVSFDVNQFHLDAKQTVDSIKGGQSNLAFITIDQSKVEEQIQLLFPQLESNNFDLKKLTNGLNQAAAKFQSGSYQFDLNTYQLSDKINKDEVLSVAVVPLKEVPDDLQNMIVQNPKIEIPDKTTFSLLGYMKDKKIKLNATTLNFIATGIYQAILPTNFEIAERNISSALPDYARLGFEAKANMEGSNDLIFNNPNKGKFYLELQIVDQQLQVTLKGEKFLYDYKISTKEDPKLPPKTIIQYSPLLLSGKTLIQSEGEDGQLIKVYRNVYQGNQLVKSDMISEDYYPPVYRVEIQSLAGIPPTTQQNGNSAGKTAGNQTGTDGTNPVSNQTPSTTNAQQGTNNSDLWGKPNEQPK